MWNYAQACKHCGHTLIVGIMSKVYLIKLLNVKMICLHLNNHGEKTNNTTLHVIDNICALVYKHCNLYGQMKKLSGLLAV